MTGSEPIGGPAPVDGALPASARRRLGASHFGVYVHVPFCATRCGYCDFNTYTAAELGTGGSTAAYVQAALAEVRLARRVLGDAGLPVSTVFFGGGTPTLLPVSDLDRLLRAIDAEFGLEPDAEVTVEANPESVDPAYLGALRGAGFTRLSVGMQSARPHVLAGLDRRHMPGRPEQCVRWARDAGFGQVSLDLIYGGPGESIADWRASLDAAIGAGPDHVSAYALVVEDGTRLAARVRRGELAAPQDDDLADKYLLADERLTGAGLGWYEVSNWSRPGAQCRHNLGYWRSADWWGIGPGAHSHLGGVRWWNVKHPRSYAARLSEGGSPAQGRELLTVEDERVEQILLRLRLTAGVPLAALAEVGRKAAAGAAADGLLDATAYAEGQAVLTRRGRLLADAVVRDLVD